MAAYVSDIEDFETDKDTILDNKINLKFNEYSREEIEVSIEKDCKVHKFD